MAKIVNYFSIFSSSLIVRLNCILVEWKIKKNRQRLKMIPWYACQSQLYSDTKSAQHSMQNHEQVFLTQSLRCRKFCLRINLRINLWDISNPIIRIYLRIYCFHFIAGETIPLAIRFEHGWNHGAILARGSNRIEWNRIEPRRVRIYLRDARSHLYRSVPDSQRTRRITIDRIVGGLWIRSARRETSCGQIRRKRVCCLRRP